MMENANLRMCQLFVDELANGGVREVCIAPGSRSTPLALAFLRQPRIRAYIHLDERCAAFFALGLAQALSRPVPVVCTSGSATVNFLPAIVEARMSNTPMLVMTADRPHELRGSGANQTIDQVKLYGEQVLLSVEMPLPATSQNELVYRHVKTLAARVLATANGLSKGPVHLNFPFRKPLEPDDEAGFPEVRHEGLPFTRIERGRLVPDDRQTEALAALVDRHEKGLIVCGPRCPGGDFPAAVNALSQQCGYPILADPLSGLRYNSSMQRVVSAYDSFLAVQDLRVDAPSLVIHFGAVPISANLSAYLEKVNPEQRVHVAENSVWADDSHRTNWLLQVNEAEVCLRLAEVMKPRSEGTFSRRWLEIEQLTWEATQWGMDEAGFFDGAAVAQALRALPQRTNLFIGNSLAVRNLDQFGAPRQAQIGVFANRGASGIDGNVSTALGIAAARANIPVAAIMGDITFYHDSNGLLAVKKNELRNITFIVLNNHGGGIFRRLPVVRFEVELTKAFLTPHGLDFSALAQMYGLNYFRAESRTDFEKILEGVYLERATPEPNLVEVITDSGVDLQVQRAILDKVKNYLLEKIG